MGSNFQFKIQLLFASVTFVLLLVTTTTARWGILKNTVSDKEIAYFGLWQSCKIHNDVTTCDDFKDGDFTVIQYFNETSLEMVEIFDGYIARSLCIKPLNVTVEKMQVVNTTGQPKNETSNMTVIEMKHLCQMEAFYSFRHLERCRVFAILPTIVSFILCIICFMALFKESARGFLAALVSISIPLWSLIGVGTFTAFYGNKFNLVTFQYGWSYILAWLTIFLSGASSFYSCGVLLSDTNKESVPYMDFKN